jgi:glycosylphosphatidylinositol transamidase (GPIT) subunit GPI8
MDRTQPAFIFISGHGNAKMVFFNNGNVIFSDELETLLDIIAYSISSKLIEFA